MYRSDRDHIDLITMRVNLFSSQNKHPFYGCLNLCLDFIFAREKVEKKLAESEVIGNMNRMGIKLLSENDFTQAEMCFVTVLEYWRAHKPEHRKNLQGALFNLGTTLFKSGKLNNSSTILESAKMYLIEARNLEDLSGNREVKYAIRLADCESAITALHNEHQNPVNNLRS